jgi:hypothetical protein
MPQRNRLAEGAGCVDLKVIARIGPARADNQCQDAADKPALHVVGLCARAANVVNTSKRVNFTLLHR